MKWSITISIFYFAGLMTRKFLYCMGGFAWGLPFSFINPHPEEYWLSISFRQYSFDLAAILANYTISFLLAYGTHRLGKKLIQIYRRQEFNL